MPQTVRRITCTFSRTVRGVAWDFMLGFSCPAPGQGVCQQGHAKTRTTTRTIPAKCTACATSDKVSAGKWRESLQRQQLQHQELHRPHQVHAGGSDQPGKAAQSHGSCGQPVGQVSDHHLNMMCLK
jgi:hypothetical protein